MSKKLLFLFTLLLTGFTLQAQWISQATGFPQPSIGIGYISVVDADVVWALGYDGSSSTAPEIQAFTRTDNGGNTWTPGTIPGYSSYGVSMILGLDYNTAWAPIWGPSGGGKLMKTEDGGTTWVEKNSGAFPSPSGFPNIVHFFNSNDGMCMGDPVGGYYEIYTTSDGGETWTRVPQADIPAPIANDDYGVVGYYSAVGNSIWFGTNKGRVFISNDKGFTWTVSTVATGMTYTDVSFIDASHGIAFDRSASGTAMHETWDGGNTWTQIVTNGIYYPNHFAWVPGTTNTCVSTGSASGMSGASFSFDGGHTWTEFNGTTGIQFLATAWADTQNGWAGDFTDQTNPTTVGGMYKYNDNLVDIVRINPREGGMVVYPNPAGKTVNFTVVGFEGKEVTLCIYDAVGQVVLEERNANSPLSFNKVLNLNSLHAGTYIAEARSGDRILRERLVIR